MPSIREVAKEAGVSIATVSRVINNAGGVAPGLHRKVSEAVKTCRYEPSVGKRSLTSISLIYPEGVWIGSPYDSACVQGMADAMRETNFDLLLVDVKRDKLASESLKQFFTRKGILGAVVRSTSSARTAISQWAVEGLPLVVLGDHFDCPKLPFVYAASTAASRQAVEHLVSLGHQRIAFAACDRDDGDHLDRLSAYRGVLESHQLYDEKLVCRVPPHRLDGAQLLRNMLGMSLRPTAIFIADPLIAVGAINEAHRLGVRVPEDLSIIGFDDCDTRKSVYPQMTAVCQDATVLGRAAVQSLLSQIESAPAAKRHATTSEAWFEVGSTSGPAPHNPARILPSGARMNS